MTTQIEATLGTENLAILQLLERWPFCRAYFEDQDIDLKGREELTVSQLVTCLDVDFLEEKALSASSLITGLEEYVESFLAFLEDDGQEVTSLEIITGTDKSGNPEGAEKLTIKAGEIVSIVGPTGSGKSRLLGDIEWVAQGDTPTGRKVLINGEVPDMSWRFGGGKKLVAQLSQNMNFVMDLTVEEFLIMHAESRMTANINEVVRRIFCTANGLAGEKFTLNTAVTSLSGGQSRALMIADTALLSASPVVLIDEIENAGIDRGRALDLLLSENKIVLMATHDPLLALMADRRIVIKNGGIHRVLETTSEEKSTLEDLAELDRKVMTLRTSLREGERITKPKVL